MIFQGHAELMSEIWWGFFQQGVFVVLTTSSSFLSSGRETCSVPVNVSPRALMEINVASACLSDAPRDCSATNALMRCFHLLGDTKLTWPATFVFSVHNKSGPVGYAQRGTLNCPSGNEIPDTSRWRGPRIKKHTGCTINEWWLLELLHSAGFGGRWRWCGTPGGMECFNGNAETCAVEGKDSFVLTRSF